MKTLHLVRHGKSSWDLLKVSDFDRPLLEKGVQNNYQMAEKLKVKFPKPQLILSSPANRAIHTAIIFARTLKLPLDIVKIDDSIYLTSAQVLFDLVLKTESNIDQIPKLVDKIKSLSNKVIFEIKTDFKI